MNIAGHYIKTPEGLVGERGLGYQYILASNGLFIQAETPLLRATIPVAQCQVRGLSPLNPECDICLSHGKIPLHLWSDCIRSAQSAWQLWHTEICMAILWRDSKYQIAIPSQELSRSSANYEAIPDAVMEVHSHGALGAFFSTADDQDEQGFRIYGVLGKVDRNPEYMMRVGVYGCFWPIELEQVFE